MGGGIAAEKSVAAHIDNKVYLAENRSKIHYLCENRSELRIFRVLLNKKPQTPYTAGKNYQSLVGFYASDIDKIKLDDKDGGHIYYVFNLDTHIIKFGISRNWKTRIKKHIANFVCYGGAYPERLWIVVSRKPINDLSLGEKLWLYLVKDNPYFAPTGGKEFFLYMKDNLFLLDKNFSSLIELMAGGKGKVILKKLLKSQISFKDDKSINKS